MEPPRISPTVLRGLLLLLAIAMLAVFAPTPAPQRLSEVLVQARAALRQGDAPAALGALETALRLEPTLVALHLPAAQAALASGNPTAALRHIDQMWRNEPADAQLECLRLEALAASEPLTPIGIIPPGCAGSTHLALLRAKALVSAGEPQQALALLEALPFDPADPPEILQLRAILSAALRPEAAYPAVVEARRRSDAPNPILTDLEAAMRPSPGSSAFGTALRSGQVFLQHGRPQEAALAFQRAVTLQPGSIEAQAYLAYAQARQDPQAITRLRAIEAEAPDAFLPHLLEAMALRESGSPTQATAALEAGLALEPGNPALLAEMGAAQLSAGDLPHAAHWYRLAAESARTDPAYWRLLARFSLDHSVDTAGLAFPAARNAIALDPQNAEGWDLLGHAHLVAGDLRLADRMLRNAIRLDPGWPAAHYHLGLASLAKADPATARAAFETVLRIDPEGEFAVLAERSLTSLGE